MATPRGQVRIRSRTATPRHCPAQHALEASARTARGLASRTPQRLILSPCRKLLRHLQHQTGVGVRDGVLPTIGGPLPCEWSCIAVAAWDVARPARARRSSVQRIPEMSGSEQHLLAGLSLRKSIGSIPHAADRRCGGPRRKKPLQAAQAPYPRPPLGRKAIDPGLAAAPRDAEVEAQAVAGRDAVFKFATSIAVS